MEQNKMENYTYNCEFCDKEYKTNIIAQHFCSDKCKEEYWKNPKIMDITTTCPMCKKEISRGIYAIELMAYQALVLCPDCSNEPMIYPTVTFNN